jgi:ubiquinone/menaquinone biosynthesis C-methylase UbiE
MKIIQTAERVSDKDMSDNYVYQRSLLAYVEAAKIVSGNVLEIGTGSGYGIKIISAKADKFVTIDKFENESVQSLKETYSNVVFIKIDVPPLTGIADNSVDYVITFQVIEHIQNDKKFVNEIYRVLKNKGKLIVTTPNKKMSITRNPWHIREYTIGELESLLKTKFQSVEKLGVSGNEKIMDYYNKNKQSVEKFTRFDILNLQYRLPRQLLQIPYDILNRMNRKKLLKNNTSLVSDIKMEDYLVEPANDKCFDLFYVAEKITR